MLDIGCGPGFYVAELLEQVGSGGSVIGVDVSGDMLAVAARRTEGHENVEFHERGATSLPLPDQSVDRAVSVQWSSMSMTSRPRCTRCTVCCAPADGSCCGASIGARSPGTPSIGI